jgi:hypothetical protein
MTEYEESDDTTGYSECVEYKTVRPAVPDEPPSTAEGVDPRAHRDAVKHHHSPSSPPRKVSVHVDTEIINRRARADELNSRLDDSD